MIKGIRSGLAAIVAASALVHTPVAKAGENFLAMNTVPEPGIRVVLNHAKIVKLSEAASTVIIGNPEIADATVRDAQTLVLTGRGFGQTNLVILDANGNPILDERIAVSRENGTALRIYRQADIETLSCEPYCERAYLTEAEVQSIRAVREANRAGNNDDN